MLEIEKHKFFFKKKEIWFSDRSFDIDDVHEVIFRACKNNVRLNGFESKEFTTLVIDLTKDLKQIWQDMNDSSTRYIRRAEKEGITVRLNCDYDNFHRLNCLFRKQKGEIGRAHV